MPAGTAEFLQPACGQSLKLADDHNPLFVYSIPPEKFTYVPESCAMSEAVMYPQLSYREGFMLVLGDARLYHRVVEPTSPCIDSCYKSHAEGRAFSCSNIG